MLRATIFHKAITAIRVFINWPWVVPDRLGWVGTIDYRTRLGPVMRCRGGQTDSGTVAVVFWGLEYTENLLQLKGIQEDAVIWDLGANIGAFAVWAHHMANKQPVRILCVEPDEGNIDLLQQNLTRNGVDAVMVVTGVVGPTDGVAWLDSRRGKDAIRVSGTPTAQATSQYRLETLASKHQVDRVNLLKMDIEGSEFATLEASAEFVREKVDLMVVETHGGGVGLDNQIVKLFATEFDVVLISEAVLFFRSKGRHAHSSHYSVALLL